jgi:hypothetical protein
MTDEDNRITEVQKEYQLWLGDKSNLKEGAPFFTLSQGWDLLGHQGRQNFIVVKSDEQRESFAYKPDLLSVNKQ